MQHVSEVYLKNTSDTLQTLRLPAVMRGICKVEPGAIACIPVRAAAHVCPTAQRGPWQRVGDNNAPPYGVYKHLSDNVWVKPPKSKPKPKPPEELIPVRPERPTGNGDVELHAKKERKKKS